MAKLAAFYVAAVVALIPLAAAKTAVEILATVARIS